MSYTQNAYVRMNQLGYVAGASKRAYLMSSQMEAGATFNVKDSRDNSVYSAPIGANQGSGVTTFPLCMPWIFPV